VKIADIRPDTLQVNAIVKVMSTEVKLQCMGHPDRKIAEVVVGDETGTMVLRVPLSQIKVCNPGTALVVRGARVELFNGFVRLELGRWSRLDPIEGAAFAPNRDVDMSLATYALVPQ